MNSQGAINPEALLDLFQELASSGKNYKIVVTKDSGLSTTFFYQDGNLILALEDSDQRPVNYLIGEGIISEEQADEIVKYKKESGMPLDQLLVQAEILGEDDLKKLFHSYARNHVIDLFTCEKGSYRAEEISTTQNSLAVFALSDLSESEAEIHQMLNDLGDLGSTKDVYSIHGKISNQEFKEGVLNFFTKMINGKHTVDEILVQSLFSTARTLKILNQLRKAGQIKKNGIAADRQTEESPKEKTADKRVKEDASVVKTQASSGISSDNISGALSFLSLVEIIQTLYNSKKTGVLTIDLPNGKGVINILKGEIVGSSYGSLKNRDAFYKLVTIKDGNFSFLSGKQDFSKEMEIPTMNLLMEAMRLSDETAKQSNESSSSNGALATESKNIDTQPKASRRLKRKESKFAFIVKTIIFFLILLYILLYLFVFHPAEVKKEAFAQYAVDVKDLANKNQFLLALEKWDHFAKDHLTSHPDWKQEVDKQRDLILSAFRANIEKTENEIQRFLKVDDFNKCLENLDTLQTWVPSEKEDTAKAFAKERTTLTKLRETIMKQQKERDYQKWRANFDQEFENIKKIITEFEHAKALDKIAVLKNNLNQDTDKDLVNSIVALEEIVHKRESLIENALKITQDKNASFSDKINAYSVIIANAGEKQPRGIQANKELLQAKDKMASYEKKFSDLLQAKSKDSFDARIEAIEQLQKEVSSKEEFSFLEKQKIKILGIKKENNDLIETFYIAVKKKDFADAFKISKKIISTLSDQDIPKGLFIPFRIESEDQLIIKIENQVVTLPYDGQIDPTKPIKLSAEKKGCKPILLILDKVLDTYVLQFSFKKAELWATEFKGNLKIPPQITTDNKSVVLANKNNIEMLLLQNGSRIWQRQINNPNQPFKKVGGANIIVGDDDFWNIDSPPIVFERYIGINGKNAELFVLSAEDGNHLVRYETNLYSKCSPMLLRLPLLGNKIFAFTGTVDNELLCITAENQTVRFQEKVEGGIGGILGVYPISEQSFVVITEQKAFCFASLNGKLKWTKDFNNKVKEIYFLGHRIFVRQTDGLQEITEAVENWKLSTFPIRDIKSMIICEETLLIIGENKKYVFDSNTLKFTTLPDKISDIFYANGKFMYAIDQTVIKAYDIQTSRLIWETEAVQNIIREARVSKQHLFFLEGIKLHATYLE